VNNMIWLIRREIWENRSLWIAPLVVAGVILIAAAFGGMHIQGKDSFSFGWNPETGAELSAQDRESIHNAIGSVAQEKKQLIYAIALSALTSVLLFVMVIVLFFYLLDCLLAERKDRSILFWKSLPVSDTQVVLSKLFTAAVLAPVFVLLLSSVLQAVVSLAWSVRFSGSPLGEVMVVWDGPTWLQLQAAYLLFLTAGILWYLPLMAYLMLVSVWARRNAFLWAVLPPVSVLAIEGLILQSNNFGEFLGRRFIGIFELLEQGARGANEDAPTLGDVLHTISGVLTSAETWLGVLVAAAMIFGAIRIRRFRDDS